MSRIYVRDIQKLIEAAKNGEAPPSLRIKVTNEIILTSTPMHKRHCMVANAIRAQIDHSYSVNVTGEFVRFNIGDSVAITGVRLSYPLPGRVLQNIERYDWDRENGLPCSVVEYTFTLDGRSPDATMSVVRKAKPRVRRPQPEMNEEMLPMALNNDRALRDVGKGEKVMVQSWAQQFNATQEPKTEPAVVEQEVKESNDSTDEIFVRCPYRRYRGLTSLMTARRRRKKPEAEIRPEV